jgi:hypothetical protein
VQNWLKTQLKKLFLTELKWLWHAGTGPLKSRGNTMKSDISSFPVYLQ